MKPLPARGLAARPRLISAIVEYAILAGSLLSPYLRSLAHVSEITRAPRAHHAGPPISPVQLTTCIPERRTMCAVLACNERARSCALELTCKHGADVDDRNAVSMLSISNERQIARSRLCYYRTYLQVISLGIG